MAERPSQLVRRRVVYSCNDRCVAACLRTCARAGRRDRVNVYLVKPTRYDDGGYPIQWWRPLVASNSSACVTGIVKHTPNLAGAPLPLLGQGEVSRNLSGYSSFDLGRGCPFECSFCTIINVQGRKSRFRTPDDLEQIIRANAAVGIYKFFLTDDNF